MSRLHMLAHPSVSVASQRRTIALAHDLPKVLPHSSVIRYHTAALSFEWNGERRMRVTSPGCRGVNGSTMCRLGRTPDAKA